MTKDIRFCGIFLLLALCFVVVGGAIGGFAPPPSPDLAPEAIAAIYRAHGPQILVLAVCMMLSCTCCLPAYAAFTVLMRRMQPRSWFLPILHLLGAVFAVGGPYFSAMFFAAAAYRPDLPPVIIRSLNDLAVMFNQVSMPGALPHGISLYLAVRRDHALSDDPVLPRWVGVLYLVYALFSLPGLFTIFFKGGPFAWNGYIGLGMPMAILAPWMILSAIALFRVAPAKWSEAEQL